MSKHIHLHIHRARQRAADAGFDESKHKRDAGGRFSTSSGDVAHHEAQSRAHMQSRAKHHPDSEQADRHHDVAEAHASAARWLRNAQEEHDRGRTAERDHNLKRAEAQAQHAKKLEQALGAHRPAGSTPEDRLIGHVQSTPAAKRAAAPKGFKKGSEGHLEASAKERAGHLANRKAAVAHLEAAGFQPDRANNKHKTFGTGAHAQEEQHFAYKHPDGRTASVVHVTTGWAGGGFTKIKHA